MKRGLTSQAAAKHLSVSMRFVEEAEAGNFLTTMMAFIRFNFKMFLPLSKGSMLKVSTHVNPSLKQRGDIITTTSK
jgi:hypothetical protein